MKADVFHYFQQACRRPLLPWDGNTPRVEAEEAEAAFRIDLKPDLEIIDSVEYRCTTCMTLVGICEHVAEELRGSTLTSARKLSPEAILNLHPEIPQSRRPRAHLAVAAAHAALDRLTL